MELDNDLRSRLVSLFKETISAHHQAYVEVDGADPDWPLWYADYLHEPLRELLKANFTRSELVYLLVLVDKEHRLRAPGAEWTGYYARFFLERFS